MKTKCPRCLKRYPETEKERYCTKCKDEFGLGGSVKKTIEERETDIKAHIQSLINKYRVEISQLNNDKAGLVAQIAVVHKKIEVYTKTLNELEEELTFRWK